MPPRFHYYDRRSLAELAAHTGLGGDALFAADVVARVLPFRVSSHVVDELIDWRDVPNDPIYQLTFPQRDMLDPDDFAQLADLVLANAPESEVDRVANEIRARLNPHPAGQKQLNVPTWNGRPLEGVQHKYRETVLVFPRQAQTCHSYCTYCFRWAQFVGIDDLSFATREMAPVVDYIRSQPQVTNVLLTGGDPMVMKASVLRRYLEPLLDVGHVATIRIGTKSLAYWPHRFTTDPDADELVELFEAVARRGVQLAVMAHASHPRELESRAAEHAIHRIRATGATIYGQAPLIKHVNDDATTWARLWRRELALGVVPYYMFVERDTGAHRYFEVPLARAHEIFRDAYRALPGLCRTVRGPSMSATPGKVVIDGVVELAGTKQFALRFIQARDPEWVGRPFFAAFDPHATWLDQLLPAFGEREFFFEAGMRRFAPRRKSLLTMVA
jgi:KamA family protein